MIYLDNAATTYPKPPCVRYAVAQALEKYGANPGRGGHRMAMETAEAVYACRENAAHFFGLDDPTRVVFTANCTEALNTVLQGLLQSGDHVVVSDMEHNAVMRPLTRLREQGVEYSQAVVCEYDRKQTVENFRQAIRPNTKLILCLHASNVFGTVLPIRELGLLAHRNGIFFAVDGAQSAGLLPINMQKDEIDFLCLPSHKGLYGPMGAGMLLCNTNADLLPLKTGGTGSQSLSMTQPEELPDRLESGTLNVPGICGLNAGLLWLQETGRANVLQHERWVMQYLYDMLSNCPFVKLYTAQPCSEHTVPLVSFNLLGKVSEEVAEDLAKEGVAVRAGLHCAPCAHRRAGTLQSGVVRVAPSAFTRRQEVENLYKILIKIARKP